MNALLVVGAVKNYNVPWKRDLNCMIKTMRFVICLPSERRCIGWRVLERFAAVMRFPQRNCYHIHYNGESDGKARLSQIKLWVSVVNFYMVLDHAVGKLSVHMQQLRCRYNAHTVFHARNHKRLVIVCMRRVFLRVAEHLVRYDHLTLCEKTVYTTIDHGHSCVSRW